MKSKLLAQSFEMGFGNVLLMIRKYILESIKEECRVIRASLLSIGLGCSYMFDQPESEIQASKDISVIVAVHDSPDVTRRCLQSLEEYGANAEIVLVDDGSQLQETVDLLEDYQQRNAWILVQHDEALGLSQSCMDGSQVCTRKYICFLNSDTVVTPWSWRAAKEAFDLDQRIAVTGPSTSWAATKQAVRRAMYCRHYWTNSQIYAFAKRYTSKQSSTVWVDLPIISGFAFFIRRDVWNELGGFDCNLPDYGNEAELCNRLLGRGFRLVWTPKGYIHHFGHGSYYRIMDQDIMKAKRRAAQAYIDNKMDTGAK